MDQLALLIQSLETLVASSESMESSIVLDKLGFKSDLQDIIRLKSEGNYIVRRAIRIGFDWNAIIVVKADSRCVSIICENAHFDPDELKSIVPENAISKKASLLPTAFNLFFQYGRAKVSVGVSSDKNKIGNIEVKPAKKTA